jgi:hypothetical protein
LQGWFIGVLRTVLFVPVTEKLLDTALAQVCEIQPLL